MKSAHKIRGINDKKAPIDKGAGVHMRKNFYCWPFNENLSFKRSDVKLQCKDFQLRDMPRQIVTK